MGANKLYVAIESVSEVDPDELLTALPTGKFFRWERVRDGVVTLCRHSHDREIVRRMIDAEREKVTQVAMVEIYDTAMTGTGYLYKRVGEDLVLVDQTSGDELYGADVADYLERRYGIDARRL
ncbi:hypothetical protein [Natrinema sp. 74]|uniref:hypothetical protein n=1 Tax=Natrinema sp. 74 TaxID=3384159 RepID=UPI0038D36EC0